MPEFASSFEVGLVVDYYEPQAEQRLAICRGPHCFLAYIGVPRGHPLDGVADLEFPCHWGVNFQGYSTKLLPPNFYWWGWDYGHAGDILESVDADVARVTAPLEGTRHALADIRRDAMYIFDRFKESVALAKASAGLQESPAPPLLR